MKKVVIFLIIISFITGFFVGKISRKPIEFQVNYPIYYTIQEGDFEIPGNINYRDYNCEIELIKSEETISTKMEILRVYASV